MSIGRILAIATGLEFVALAAFMAVRGLLGFHHDHYDLSNNFAPIWLVMGLAGAVLGWFALGRRRARLVMLAATLVVVLAFGLPVLAEAVASVTQRLQRPAATNPALRVVSFNASANTFSTERSTQVLLAADPDIILIQEPVLLLADRALTPNYPYAVQCNDVSACELAILSKRPIVRSGKRLKRLGDAGLGDLEFLWAETTAPDGRPVTVATTHYIWQLQRGQKSQRILLERYAAALPERDLVLSGDFNLTPWTFAMRAQDRRLQPLTRRTHALATWPAYVPRLFAPVLFPFMPIDHLYAGPAWKTVAVERLRGAASDHYPVMVTLAR